MEKISVIVPIYKVERFLDKCVDSIVKQTYTNLEIILVDDGSPDSCPALCDDWTQRDKRIRVIHKENGGLSDARNIGLDCAVGKFVTFVDSDDYIPADCIEKLHKALVENNADISAGNYLKVNDHGVQLKKEKWECIDYSILSGSEVLYRRFDLHSPTSVLVMACAKLYKRDIFRNFRFAKGRLNEDEFAFFPIYSQVEKVVCIEDIVYFYLQREDSIMGQKISEKRIKDNIDYWEERLILTKQETALYKRVAVAYCSWIYLTALPNTEENSILRKVLVKKYRKYIVNYVFDRKVDLPMLHRIVYFISVINPYRLAKIKCELSK